jgi:hypothetical protein
VASEQPAQGQPTPAERAIAGKRADCIGRAARRVAAARRKDPGRANLPSARGQDQQPGDHLVRSTSVRAEPVEALPFPLVHEEKAWPSTMVEPPSRCPGDSAAPPSGRTAFVFIFRSAFSRSDLNCSNGRSIPPGRPIRTWSAPVIPASGRMARASSRNRRFIRLRTTAPPTFFETVMPSRIAGSPSSRGRTSRTNPGMGARRPAFAAR